MGGYCSLVILCLGAVSALSAIALVAIAASTDHWVETRVDREAVEKAGKQSEVRQIPSQEQPARIQDIPNDVYKVN